MVPTAKQELIFILDEFMEWVFRFDDIFDNGDLRSNYDAAKIVIDYLISKCENDADVALPSDAHVKAAIEIARLHEPIHEAIKARSTPGKPPKIRASSPHHAASTFALRT